MKYCCNYLQEDIVLLGKFMQRNFNFNNNIELEDSNLLLFGFWVRRKLGWRYGDQDMGRLGMVIGYDKGNIKQSKYSILQI